MNKKKKIDIDVEHFYNNNWAYLEALWEDYLGDIQANDSIAHFRYVRDSDECFWEFVADQMSDTKTKKTRN